MKFIDIKLIEPIQKALVKNGYINPTPIQEKAIPKILEGKDLFGIAQTGTGKTAAFTLPVLQLMYNQSKSSTQPRTLVLAPTRELAAQIGDSFQNYGSFTKFKHTVIFGGINQSSQENALSRGVDIIIATPGRLLDLLNQGFVNLNNIEYFILDEADRMLDMGFINDIKKIIKKLPKERQSLFFSATMSTNISSLAKTFLKNPERVEVTPQATTIEKIKQGLYFVDKENKDQLLLEIIGLDEVKSALVFTRTKHKANKIAKFLSDNKIPSEAIHGNKSQPQRERALNNFKSGKNKVLVATEIVARGIDIDEISHVINYEIPNEPESYVHRIGRTARAGTKGIAYSFCSADERNYVNEIEKIIKQKIPIINHKKHSNFAQNAKGSDAKPIPKAILHDRRKKEKWGSDGNRSNRNNNNDSSSSGISIASNVSKEKKDFKKKPFNNENKFESKSNWKSKGKKNNDRYTKSNDDSSKNRFGKNSSSNSNNRNNNNNTGKNSYKFKKKKILLN